MDFHAHMNMNEVIGLLAGECNEDRRLIRSTFSAMPYLFRREEDDLYELMPDSLLVHLQVTFPPLPAQVMGWPQTIR